MYNHGITLTENPTSIQQPTESLSAVQVVIGTAPINLVDNVEAVVNKPILVRSMDEAKQKLGYSSNWDEYTLCEVMDASFKKFKVGPVVFINVLDPSEHKESVANLVVTIQNKQARIEDTGVLLDSLVVKSSDGSTTFTENTDYLSAFDQDGKPVISILSTGAIPPIATQLQVTFDKLDPSAVNNLDIIGGYDSTSNSSKGLELIQSVFPTLGLIPNIILAPGFSHEIEVGAILSAKSNGINGSFNAIALLDVKGKTKEDAVTEKETKEFNEKSSIVCWPKAKIDSSVYHLSTIIAATMVRTDAENEDIPYKSPSNKRIPINALVNDDGQEIFLDYLQGNTLNANGIVTAINMNGWRTWGNNTAAFNSELPGIMDPKDRFIAVRRMFDWWGNSFIINYFDKVDDPGNYRLIESLVDSENIRANGYQARGHIAGAKIEFRQADNPISQILNGKIKFVQKVAFFTPAEEIVNVLEFDPTILSNSLFGGE